MGERFNIKDIDKERYIAIPMALFTQENYAGLDNTARLIYGFLKSRVNVLPPIEAGASCFSEYSTTSSKELRRLTHSPQA